MTEKTTKRDRRDWTLIIFLLPIGIIFMLIAGQIAIRLVPSWRVIGGMESNLDPNSASGGQPALFQPISFDILTPMSWLDSFLTPGPDSANRDLSFAPFVVFEPSETPSPVVSPTISNTPPTPTTTTTATTSPTVTTTWTKKPTSDPPTSTATTVSPTATTPSPTGSPSTPGPTLTLVSPAPTSVSVGTPDGTAYNIPVNRYIVLDLGTAGPVIVEPTPDDNYDMVFYEWNNGGSVAMDHVIVGISHLANGSVYYQVFYWGDTNRDTNTNIGNIVTSTPYVEDDNQVVPLSSLYPSPVPTDTPTGTGILIDVDTAISSPPPGPYQYIVIISPNTGDGDEAQVDSVEITEVPTP